ncbi:MAG: aspartyl/asparaginyl beta-hydroxylase domain-containing protein [Xanthomonadaceae bacterium]|nr:aspartyl/asparaginyl beta-hydroxylase domain-containing protein [Xanthomonadaceae bacterium]
MQLQVPFVQLPLRFDADRLAAEVARLGDDAWREHPQKYPGNYALPLISVDGDPASDAIAGPMQPTEYLQRCPYLQHALARLGAVWGRTRLMKLAPGAEVTPHADINYYWRDRVRVHVPVLTHPEVRFICGDSEVNMAAGECWIFDTWRPHRVINPVAQERIHLVADTVGSEAFWGLAERGRTPGHGDFRDWRMEEFDPAGAVEAPANLAFEAINVPQVMTPWELRNHLQFILDHVAPHSHTAVVQRQAARFIANWQALWARYGESHDGWPAYRAALDAFARHMETYGEALRLINGMRFLATLRSMVLGVALADRHERPLTDEQRLQAEAGQGALR